MTITGLSVLMYAAYWVSMIVAGIGWCTTHCLKLRFGGWLFLALVLWCCWKEWYLAYENATPIMLICSLCNSGCLWCCWWYLC